MTSYAGNDSDAPSEVSEASNAQNSGDDTSEDESLSLRVTKKKNAARSSRVVQDDDGEERARTAQDAEDTDVVADIESAMGTSGLSDSEVEMELSLTMSKHKGHVPPAWATILHQWMQKSPKCIAGCITLERGGKAQHLHCQGVLRVKMDPNFVEVLKLELKKLVGWQRGDGSGTYVQLKEFAPAQDCA